MRNREKWPERRENISINVIAEIKRNAANIVGDINATMKCFDPAEMRQRVKTYNTLRKYSFRMLGGGIEEAKAEMAPSGSTSMLLWRNMANNAAVSERRFNVCAYNHLIASWEI